MKQGEQEAKAILKSQGLVFDESYSDDNSKESMPDLKLESGRYIEVTHTLHNNDIVRGLNRFHKKSIEEQLQIMSNAKEAYDRIMTFDYPKTLEGITSEGEKQFKKDAKIVKEHFGIRTSDFTKHSEFNCDVPIIECSTDNIIREIKEKSPKYPNGDTDLFIFILEDEYDCLCELLRTGTWNGCYNAFMRSLIVSPFKIVYLCVWSFETQTYNIQSPILLKLETLSEQHLAYSQLR